MTTHPDVPARTEPARKACRLPEDADAGDGGVTIAAALAQSDTQPVETFAYAKGAQWCQPGDMQERRWIVRFDDADRRDAVFTNGKEAREFWDKANLSWNCYLFATEPLYTAPPRPDASGLIEAADLAEQKANELEQSAYSSVTPLVKERCRSEARVCRELAQAYRTRAADRSAT